MKPKNILISVVIPYFKKRKYINSCIKSILKQNHKKIEVIIVYDDENREDLTYLGVMSEIIQTGANDVYVVSLSEEPDVLLPVIPNVIINIELDNNKMIVRVPLGLDRKTV